MLPFDPSAYNNMPYTPNSDILPLTPPRRTKHRLDATKPKHNKAKAKRRAKLAKLARKKNR